MKTRVLPAESGPSIPSSDLIKEHNNKCRLRVYHYQTPSANPHNHRSHCRGTEQNHWVLVGANELNYQFSAVL